MNVPSTIADAKKCFGEHVIKHSLLIITKYNDRVPKAAKEWLEEECKTLDLKYVYFDTSYDDYKVPEEERNK